MTSAAGFSTRCIHAGEAPDPTTGAHGVPLYQNVTFAFETNGQVEAMRSGERPHFTYSPRGNPTVRCLELKIADLEGAEASIAMSSGMAAISSVLLTLLADGGHLVASGQLYDLTSDFMRDDLPALGGSASFVDLSDVDAIQAAISPRTRAIYVEPFSNPLLRVSDIRMLAKFAHENNLLLVVDNTFLSPALFRPVALGADIVLHSATKYLSGNGQVQGGVVSGPRRLIDPIRSRALRLGATMPPFAAWLLLAGIHTRAAHGAPQRECVTTSRSFGSTPRGCRDSLPWSQLGSRTRPSRVSARRRPDSLRRHDRIYVGDRPRCHRAVSRCARALHD
ncbi:MAG: methionine gamma-lyase, partial [Thermomicrobiales bacterium]|nr:methionine gamma-lyase [Thermomicrobiales bacterium]